MILALFAPVLVAALGVPAGAKSAAPLVPTAVRAAILLDGDAANAGIAGLLGTAGRHAASLSPESFSRELSSSVGVDLLGDTRAFGLAASGPRALVFASGSIALSAPLADAKVARRAVDAWLGLPTRKSKPLPLKGADVAGNRAALIAGGRLYIGSGPHAAALVNDLSHPGACSLAKDKTWAAALALATGPAAIWFRADALLRGGLFSIDARATGLSLRGLLLPAGDAPLLVGEAPVSCGDGKLACLRAELGAGGRALFAAGVRDYVFRAFGAGQRDYLDRLTQRAAATAGKIAVRLDGLDAHLLGDESDSIWALRLAAAVETPAPQLPPGDLPRGFAKKPSGLSAEGRRPLCVVLEPKSASLSTPCMESPSLSGGSDHALESTLDPAAIDRALSMLSPLDALHGPVAAGAYAAHLIYGALLRSSGPASLTGQPAGAAAELELRIPIR